VMDIYEKDKIKAKLDKTEDETEKSARDRKECTKAGDLIARRVKSQLQSTLGQPKSTH
ncbi:hypothetical protein Tco_1140817, partial [Tanacetum coccineum]